MLGGCGMIKGRDGLGFIIEREWYKGRCFGFEVDKVWE